MSDLPMKQEDHPAHNMPTATEDYRGVSKAVPNFNAPMTGRNSPDNNWEDQRSTDNRVNNAMDIDEAGAWRK